DGTARSDRSPVAIAGADGAAGAAGGRRLAGALRPRPDRSLEHYAAPARSPAGIRRMTPAPDPSGSALQRLCAEVVALRERNDRQHKLFDQAIAQVRDDLQSRFGQFAADVQSAYQRLRDELTGEKGRALTALNALANRAPAPANLIA